MLYGKEISFNVTTNPKPKILNMYTFYKVCIQSEIMPLISTRVPEELDEELEWYAEKEKVGKTIALRRILDKGLREIRLEYALDLYQNGKITLMKASEIAAIPLWEILEIVRGKKVPMYYTLEDVEKDIKSALK